MAHCFKLAIAQCAVLAEQTHQAAEVPIQWQSVSFLIFFSVRFECSPHSFSELEILFILRSLLNLI